MTRMAWNLELWLTNERGYDGASRRRNEDGARVSPAAKAREEVMVWWKSSHETSAALKPQSLVRATSRRAAVGIHWLCNGGPMRGVCGDGAA